MKFHNVSKKYCANNFYNVTTVVTTIIDYSYVLFVLEC